MFGFAGKRRRVLLAFLSRCRRLLMSVPFKHEPCIPTSPARSRLPLTTLAIEAWTSNLGGFIDNKSVTGLSQESHDKFLVIPSAHLCHGSKAFGNGHKPIELRPWSALIPYEKFRLKSAGPIFHIHMRFVKLVKSDSHDSNS